MTSLSSSCPRQHLSLILQPKVASKPEEAKAEEPKPVATPLVPLQPANVPVTPVAPVQAQPASLSPQAEETIATLIATSGKPRESVIRALEMAGFDPNDAFELLMIEPEQLAQMQMQHQMMGGDMEEDDGDYGDEDSDGQGSGLAAFVNNPQFQQLRQRMLQNPAFFLEFMGSLQQNHPELY